MISEEEFFEAVDNYIHSIRKELHARWDKRKFDPAQAEIHEVVGALMARQVTLATQLAGTPAIWNGHVAPVLLRTMVDVYITLAWILREPLDRSRKFTLYGLGQEKLYLEHLKVSLTETGEDPENHPVTQILESWINSQRFTFLTDVNVGSWSGLNTRTMAQEADCMDLYRYAYSPFSSSTHSTWNHIAKYNLQPCHNPLHRHHMVPVDSDDPIDPDYLYRAAKYMNKTFVLFDNTFEVTLGKPSAFKTLAKVLEQLVSTSEEGYSEDLEDKPET